MSHSIKRRCRGPFEDSASAVLERMKRSRHIQGQEVAELVGDEASTAAAIGRLIGSHPDAARALKDAAHGGCGQDLAEEIEQLPADGESHDFVCPACGAPHHATKT